MDAKRRQKVLRIAELASRHPSYADAIGVKIATQKRKEKGERRWTLGGKQIL